MSVNFLSIGDNKMNKLELLVSAATVIGLKHVDYSNIDYDGSYGLMIIGEHGQHLFCWDPIENNSDAFKLAVKLSSINPGCCAKIFDTLTEDEMHDKLATVRLATVLVAVEKS